jgi:hypothetical protein
MKEVPYSPAPHTLTHTTREQLGSGPLPHSIQRVNTFSVLFSLSLSLSLTHTHTLSLSLFLLLSHARTHAHLRDQQGRF